MSLGVQAVLFDLDGTLIATRRLYIEAFADALEPVVGVRLTEAEIMARHPRAERRFLEELASGELARSPLAGGELAGGEVAGGEFAGGELPGGELAAVLERFYRSYEEGHERLFQGVYTGVPDLLAALRGRRVPLGLVTGKSRRAWQVTRSRVALGPFDVEILDDDVARAKPDPEGVALAVEALGVDPGAALYVGDSLTDLEAARAAGVPAAGVLWSKKPEEVARFREGSLARGARLLPRPSDLVALLEGE